MKLRITVEGQAYEVDVEVLDEAGGAPEPATADTARSGAGQPSSAASAPATSAEVKAPVAGSVFDVKVKAGDQVEKNDTLLVLEAMKMESNVPAPQAGTVQQVLVEAGEQVTAGQLLVRLG